MVKNSVEKVFVVGGSGFLGYYCSLEFLKKKISVSTAVRGKSEQGEHFPKQIDVVRDDLDIFEASEQELTEMFKGHEAMIYSVGPDDRVLPSAPAYDFFHEKLVVQCSKVVRAAKNAGVKRVVIMNSYFAYFDRELNGLLSKNHPYVRARVEQAQACIDIGEKGVMDVMILELPYIFGCMPGRTPLWKDVFLSKFEKMKTIYFPKGGTVMIHVRDVGRVVVAATLNGEHGGKYPIGVLNMKFKEMVEIMYESLGVEKKVVTIPTWVGFLSGLAMNRSVKKKGKEGGLNYAYLMKDIMSKDFYYLDEMIENVKKDLGFKGLDYEGDYDVKSAIRTSMYACYPEKFPNFDPFTEIKGDLEIIDAVWK